MLDYPVTFAPGATLVPPREHHRPSTIDRALDEIIAQQVQGGRAFEATSEGGAIAIRIALKDGVLQMLVPRSRITVTSPDIFIVWMAGSALVLMAIAVLFLRNQVRPIERLARATESFGKGRAVPDFKPYGAIEVRRAAQAFITMRERIERYVSQRTEMLAGVSHDLKTPLTRMKLALAMMPAIPQRLSSSISQDGRTRAATVARTATRAPNASSQARVRGEKYAQVALDRVSMTDHAREAAMMPSNAMASAFRCRLPRTRSTNPRKRPGQTK